MAALRRPPPERLPLRIGQAQAQPMTEEEVRAFLANVDQEDQINRELRADAILADLNPPSRDDQPSGLLGMNRGQAREHLLTVIGNALTHGNDDLYQALSLIVELDPPRVNQAREFVQVLVRGLINDMRAEVARASSPDPYESAIEAQLYERMSRMAEQEQQRGQPLSEIAMEEHIRLGANELMTVHRQHRGQVTPGIRTALTQQARETLIGTMTELRRRGMTAGPVQPLVADPNASRTRRAGTPIPVPVDPRVAVKFIQAKEPAPPAPTAHERLLGDD